MLLVSIAVLLTSSGPSIHWSKRSGRDSIIFYMPKFRSMRTDVPNIATHLLEDPSNFISPIGGFLRNTSLDELPQLYSVLKGDMSLVGPRPALFNQDDLITLRKENGVAKLLPGITGWAQVNGRDELSVDEKVKLDVEYMQRQSLRLDLKILYLTLVKVFRSDGVSH